MRVKLILLTNSMKIVCIKHRWLYNTHIHEHTKTNSVFFLKYILLQETIKKHFFNSLMTSLLVLQTFFMFGHAVISKCLS